MTSICQHCNESVPAHAQMYQMDDLIVCSTCAGVSPAQAELAAAATQARRAGAKRKRRSGGVGVGVFAFVATMLVICGGVGYMIYTGKLGTTVAEQRDAFSGASTTNAVITRFNTLVSEANALATARKYSDAAQKFREARAVASALPDVHKGIDAAEFDSIITHYDALAAGRVPTSTEVRTVHVHAPRAQPPVDASVAEQPTRRDEPNIGFMEKGVVEPAVASTDAPADDAAVDETPLHERERTRTQAYTVPK